MSLRAGDHTGVAISCSQQGVLDFLFVVYYNANKQYVGNPTKGEIMEKYFDFLLKTSLFSGVQKQDLSSLLHCLQARIVEMEKGSPIFLEGDTAGFIGLVLEGAVQIVRDDYDGSRSVLGHAEPGELFAETYACSNAETMPVSGYALRDGKIMLFSCRKMLTVCSNACQFHNQIVKNLLQVVSEHNVSMSRKIQFMSQKTTRQKLLAYLMDQAKKAGSPEFTIPFDRQALADYLGVERSAMSAELGKLQRENVLTTRGSHFILRLTNK